VIGEHAPHNAVRELARRRIASVVGGVCRLRMAAFEGRRPYRFLGARHSASGRWEMWMDAEQARGCGAPGDARLWDSVNP
jgi:hypothetical protein